MAAEFSKQDDRFMAACIRLGRRHLARTGTNPAVSTIIVNDFGNGPIIVGSGMTGIGGRPHAEAAALAEAGDMAKGATAYVTLEPCAHHGKTPPCADALIAAGIARVVSALTDPDERVSGKGYQRMRDSGMQVDVGCMASQARSVLGSYLNRSVTKRAQVTVKLAVSRDGMIGKRDEAQFAITGKQARDQGHILRAEHDAILVGLGTALIDNPTLTCRLPGMENRSPVRIVLDTSARLSPNSAMCHTIDQAPLYIATAYPESDNAKLLAAKGARIIACELFEGRIALAELLEDLAGIGITRILVEGGAETARAFIEEGLVERIALFQSDVVVGEQGLGSPFTADKLPDGFAIERQMAFGADTYFEINKIIAD